MTYQPNPTLAQTNHTIANHTIESVGIDFEPQVIENFRSSRRSATTDFARPSDHQSDEIPDPLGRFDGWQEFELMPPGYRARRHSFRLLHRWSGVLLILATITVGSFAILWERGRRSAQRHNDLIAQAQPLFMLRQKTQLLELENTRIDQWCQMVESAKPDDSLLQVLAAVTLATDPGNATSGDVLLEVQSIELKLPIEHDRASIQPPTWATSRMALTAIAKDRDALMPWNDRLEKSGRLRDVKLSTPGGAWSEAMVKVTASPLVTRILP